jgi:DNA invertase Pin-like site-specific DNA recombinase
MPVVDGYLGVGGARPASAGRTSVARWQIERWVQARGWRIARILEEPPEPAASRPLLELALVRVESQETDGLVTTSLDQLGSSLTDVVSAIERIEAAGGKFASISEGIDLSTPTGHHMLRLLLSVVDW